MCSMSASRQCIVQYHVNCAATKTLQAEIKTKISFPYSGCCEHDGFLAQPRQCHREHVRPLQGEDEEWRHALSS